MFQSALPIQETDLFRKGDAGASSGSGRDITKPWDRGDSDLGDNFDESTSDPSDHHWHPVV